MAAPPGKTFIKLSDGRTIAVASDDASKFEYFSEGGKVMRRPKAAAPPARPTAQASPAPEAPPARPAAAPAPPAPPARAPPPQFQTTPPIQAVAPRAAAAPPPAPAAWSPPPRPPPQPAWQPPPRPPPQPAWQPPRPAPAARPRPPPRAAAIPRPGGPRRALAWPGPKLTYNMRAVTVAVLLALILTTVPVFAHLGQFVSQLSPCTVNQHSYPQVADFNVTRSFEMSAPGGTVSYNLGLAEPYSLPGKQVLVDQVENPPHIGQSEKLWWNGTVPSGGSTSISVRYQVHMSTYIWQLPDSIVGTAADVPASYRSIYLDKEWKIDPTSKVVQDLANKVTDRSKPYMQQIKDIYRYLLCPPYHYSVTQNFEPQSPEETVSRQTGDCDDFSVLFISMARYLGIPSWLELGLLYDETPPGKFGAHGWASVYVPLTNGTGEVVTIDVVNKLFLIRDVYHFGDWSSDGDAQHLQDYYTLLTYQPATSPPFQVTQTVTHDTMRTEGIVNYISP